MTTALVRAPTLWLVAILLVAVLLQFGRLDSKSFWDDELYTVRIVGQPSVVAMFTAHQGTERQPPLHYVLFYGWMRLVGTDDAALRAVSAGLSVLSVGVLAWLGWRLGGRQIGLSAAYLLAISPFMLLYGRMVRYYALALFLSLLSTALLVVILRRLEAGNGPRWLWLGYAAATVAMLLASYPTAAIWIAQNGFLAISLLRRRDLATYRRPWLVAQGAVGAGFGVWLVVEWWRITGFGQAPTPYSLRGWTALALELSHPMYAFALGETIFPWYPVALVGLIVWTVVLVVGVRSLRRLDVWGWLPAIGFAGSLVITVIAFQLFVRDLPFITLASRAIGALPFLLLIAAAGLSALPLRLRLLALAGLTVAAGVADGNYFTGRQFHNPIYAVPTREIAAMISAQARSGDLVIADRDVNLDYYYRPSAGEPPLVNAFDAGTVRSLIEDGGYSRVWLVTFGRDRTRAEAPVEQRRWIVERYHLGQTWGFVEQDPIYSQIKERIQGFEDYRYKAVVELFEQ